ncbi:MTNB-like protein [Mya arenaria]|uniref:MTNB-like protein n=1 Tax=Mya arenaria TaxID=6604 RepID=A0ABY7DZW5_MYAAR|nr:MTNB-like protein [Mya arenaria]
MAIAMEDYPEACAVLVRRHGVYKHGRKPCGNIANGVIVTKESYYVCENVGKGVIFTKGIKRPTSASDSGPRSAVLPAWLGDGWTPTLILGFRNWNKTQISSKPSEHYAIAGLPGSQRDIPWKRMAIAMEDYPESCAILARRHGVYVWGPTWEKAKTIRNQFFEVSVYADFYKMGINNLWSIMSYNDLLTTFKLALKI